MTCASKARLLDKVKAVASPPQASTFLVAAFAAFGIVLSAGFVGLVWASGRARRIDRSTIIAALLAAGWLSATWTISASGVLAQFDRRPPPMAFLFFAIPIVSVALAFGPIGTRLATAVPLWALVLVQAFRLPLELVMHQAVVEGVMPHQMSYSGGNFDIVTGATALIVAWLLATGRAGHRLAMLWNIMGSLLLLNIITIALISTPAIAAFGSEPARLNTWVAFPPFIWLPTVMVVAAMAGHLVIYRALRAR
jgi:hypothetical protein